MNDDQTQHQAQLMELIKRRTAEVNRLIEAPVFASFTTQLVAASASDRLDVELHAGGSGDDDLTARGHHNIFMGFDGNDLMIGGQGRNLMAGGQGDDIYVPRNPDDPVVEYQDEGRDMVMALFDYTLPAHVEELMMQGGQARLGSGNAMDNLLLVPAGQTQSVLVDGRAGDDTIRVNGATPQAFLIGGRGNDHLEALPQTAIVAFNRGDGHDRIRVDSNGDLTLSLGGGIRATDLTLTRRDDALVLATGHGEQIALAGFYASQEGTSAPRRHIALQLAVDASGQYDAASTDPLRNRRFVQIDFDRLVQEYEQHRQNPAPGEDATAAWSLAAALPMVQLGGPELVVGGELASTYASQGDVRSMHATACRNALDNLTWQAKRRAPEMLHEGVLTLLGITNEQQTAYPATTPSHSGRETAIGLNPADHDANGQGLRMNLSATSSSLNASMWRPQEVPLLGTPS